MANTYILTSLDDEKAAELGKIIANPTARKILNYLAENNACETDIAKELNIPLSTVHYNIQQLLKAELIKIKDFLYSEKGNKVYFYTLAKKLVLIAPKGSSIKRSKIKNILPVLLISLGISIAIKLIYPIANLSFKAKMAERAAVGIEKALGTAEAAASATETAPVVSNITQLATNYAIFFFGGALLALLLYLIFIRKASNKTSN